MAPRARWTLGAPLALCLLLLGRPSCALRAQSPSAAPRRVALVLRGESFRGGRSGHHLVVLAGSTHIQLANYRSQLESLVLPFEAAGYDVDVFTASYKTPYDDEFRAVFGDRLKVFKELEFHKSNQATNAVANLETFQEYVNKTGKEYRFMFFVRHDTRFLKNITEVILKHPAPDDTIWLYAKHPFTGDPRTAEARCSTDKSHKWNVVDRSSISWWCNDRIHVMAGKHVPAFLQLINGPTLLDSDRHHAPRWPNECWAELGPLVGGEQHIGFLEEDVIAICKANDMQGEVRVALKREVEGEAAICQMVPR